MQRIAAGRAAEEMPPPGDGIGRYIRLGPLGTALLPVPRPRVLLVDELDKSDIDLPNDLLNVLEEGEFAIPELERIADRHPVVEVQCTDDGARVPVRGGRVRCRAFPFVVLTSNGERDFPAPLLRRCIHLRLDTPDDERLAAMVRAHFGPLAAEDNRAVVQRFLDRAPRRTALRRPAAERHLPHAARQGRGPRHPRAPRRPAHAAPQPRAVSRLSDAADLLEQLVARLREAGIATDAQSLADALWLSERMTPAAPRPGEPPAAAARAPAPPARPPDPEPDTALPQPLGRALRPLRHYRPRRIPGRPGELDEAATAESSARSGRITPVFHQIHGRESQLLLLMDDSPSMVVWEDLLEQLRLVCEQVGAFRDVGVHYLRPRLDGGVGVAALPGGLAPLAPADRLRDPTGRTVLLLLSDCCGPLWRYGAVQRLLHRFARTGPVAVIQPLPHRMWQRARLPAEPGVLCAADLPGGPLDFVPRRRRRQPPEEGAIAVPVLSLTRTALGAWARAVSGPRRARLDAAALWTCEDDPGAAPPSRSVAPGDPEQLVGRFQAVSSPAAHHLAVHLSAAPLAYPVMRLVQQAMMPQTGAAELAEILLGDLLVGADDRPATLLPGQRDAGGPRHAPPAGRTGPWYAFAPGVRDVLLRRLGLGEASLVLKDCALYVDRIYGARAVNVPKLVLGYLSGGTPRPPGAPVEALPDVWPAAGGVPPAFAEAARGVLRRFQPGGVGPDGGRGSAGVVMAHRIRGTGAARERLARFRQHGTIRDLWEAIRLLRTAPDDPDRPEGSVTARTLLAECLLALWEARRSDDVLAEAESTARAATAAADRAGGDPGGEVAADAVAGRAHLVRGKVLLALARTQEGRSAAAVALAEAVGHLERAERLLREVPDQALAARMALVDVARERYARTGDTGWLLDARQRLDAALEPRPDGAVPPYAVLAARGRLLAVLADDAWRRNDPERAGVLAAAAVADRARAAEDPPSQAVALLELAVARALAAGDPGTPQVLADLGRALAAADRDGAGDEVRCACLRRLGRGHAARFTRTGDVGELADADRWFALAQRPLPPGDPLLARPAGRTRRRVDRLGRARRRAGPGHRGGAGAARGAGPDPGRRSGAGRPPAAVRPGTAGRAVRPAVRRPICGRPSGPSPGPRGPHRPPPRPRWPGWNAATCWPISPAGRPPRPGGRAAGGPTPPSRTAGRRAPRRRPRCGCWRPGPGTASAPSSSTPPTRPARSPPIGRPAPIGAAAR